MAANFTTVFWRSYKSLWDDEVFTHAAQVAFFFTFALFPLLLFLTSVFGMVLHGGEELKARLFAYLGQIMPGSAFTLVTTWIDEVAIASSGEKLTFGLVLAVWSASAGIDNLRTSLNAVYGIKETRSWLQTRALSIVLTLALSLLVALTLLLIFYGTELVQWLFPILPQGLTTFVSYPIILVALLVAFAIVFNLVPNHPTPTWQWFTPGAFTGILLWLIFSGGFKVYLTYFDTYARTYGSLGAVIILLLWLYLTAIVVLVGGVINKVVADLRDQDSSS